MTIVSAASSSATSSSERARAASWAAFASSPHQGRGGVESQVRDRAGAEVSGDDLEGGIQERSREAAFTSSLETDASPSELLVRTRTVDMRRTLLEPLAIAMAGS